MMQTRVVAVGGKIVSRINVLPHFSEGFGNIRNRSAVSGTAPQIMAIELNVLLGYGTGNQYPGQTVSERQCFPPQFFVTGCRFFQGVNMSVHCMPPHR